MDILQNKVSSYTLMFSKDDLIIGSLPSIFDHRLAKIRSDMPTKDFPDVDIYDHYMEQAKLYLNSSKRNKLIGLEQLPYVDAIIGCTHFIDNLLLKYNISGLQIFEHDYTYYKRLDPQISYAKVGHLIPGKPILIAAPFPGYLDLHPQWNEILEESLNKNIDIHIDGCWLGSANQIEIDLSHTAVKSIGLSFSKSLGFHWNRIGLRFSKIKDDTDSISIHNRFHMIPEYLMRNALIAMQELSIDYLWDTYETVYADICRELYLRPSKIIYAAQSIDRKNLYGLKKLIEQG
jgi:hypothetical protein